MYINRDAKTYAGEKARIIQISTTANGRRLFALKTRETRPVAMAWDDPTPLERHAQRRLLALTAKND